MLFVAGISLEMFTVFSTLFFLIQYVKKYKKKRTPNFCICFSKPLDLSLTNLEKIKLKTTDEIEGQNKD